jgi:hypothetical protein
MIFGKTLIFGLGDIVFEFTFNGMKAETVGLLKYKIGDIGMKETLTLLVPMSFEEMMRLHEDLKTEKDTISVGEYTFDFSKAGGKESKNVVLRGLNNYIDTIRYTLAC